MFHFLSLGSAYTPSAQILHIQDLPKKRKKKYVNPLGEDGKLRYPPKKTKEEEDEERRQLRKCHKKSKTKATPGIISLYELLSGDFWKKEEEKKQRILNRKKTKERIMQKQKMEFVDDEQV